MTEPTLDALYRKYYKTMPPKLQLDFNIYQHDAEDAFTDAFIIFRRRITQGELSNDNIEGYLYVIAKRIILRSMKKRKQTIFPDLDTLIHLWDKLKEQPNLNDVEQQYAAMVHCLKQALAQLSEKCQILIEAYYFDMKKLKDLVEPLNYPSYDAIRSANLACKKKLRTLSKACFEQHYG